MEQLNDTGSEQITGQSSARRETDPSDATHLNIAATSWSLIKIGGRNSNLFRGISTKKHAGTSFLHQTGSESI
jgi:hypothetical protein